MQRYSYEDGARLLVSDLALPELTTEEALRVVPFMRLTLARKDSVLFRAGGPGSQFMVMLLEGDAVVEGRTTSGSDWMVLRTLVAGSLFGELGAMDSMARSVLVRATSETCLATLDDEALAKITASDPALGCTLLRAKTPQGSRHHIQPSHVVLQYFWFTPSVADVARTTSYDASRREVTRTVVKLGSCQ